MKKKIMLISSVLVLTVGLGACNGNNDVQEEIQVNEDTEIAESNEMPVMANLEPDEPVAIVNGEEILQQQLSRQFEQVKISYQQQGMEINAENEVIIQNYVLDQLVNTTLLHQAAIEQGLTPSNEEVQAQMDQIKDQFGSEEELIKVLEQYNLNLASVEEDIKKELTINKYIEGNIEAAVVSQDEVKERYEEYKQQTEDMPKLEDVMTQLEEEIKNEKNQALVAELVNKLKETSEIEILI